MTTLFPLALLPLMPFGLLAPRTLPMLWWVTLALAGSWLVLLALLKARPLPTFRLPWSAELGDCFLVEGQRFWVTAAFSFSVRTPVCRTHHMFLLKPANQGTEVGLVADYDAAHSYAVTQGGEAWHPNQITENNTPEAVPCRALAEGSLAGCEQLVVVPRLGTSWDKLRDLRTWPALPQPGQTPSLTWTPKRELAAEALQLVDCVRH